MDWFCYHVETIDNPKIQTLPPPLFKHWVNLLCLAKRGGGALPAVEQLAFYMRTSRSRAAAVLAELIELRLFDDHGEDGVKPHDWADWQPKSDPGSAERMRNYRQRFRDSGRTPGAYVKHAIEVFQRDGNACVYCGKTEHLCLDHSVPVVLGGDDHPDNLVTACKGCNSGKSGRTPEQAGYAFRNQESALRYKANLERLRSPKESVTVTPRARAVSISISVSSQSSSESKSALDSAFEILCEMWSKGGKPLNDRDREKALRKLMEYPGEEEQILRWCANQFLTTWREPKFTPFPDSARGLGSEGWRRPEGERTIPSAEDVATAQRATRLAERQAKGQL